MLYHVILYYIIYYVMLTCCHAKKKKPDILIDAGLCYKKFLKEKTLFWAVPTQ